MVQNKRSLIVMKFGGTSVGDLERIKVVAQKIHIQVEKNKNVIVVVSAMSGTTNNLIKHVEELTPFYDAREYSAVVSSGENITSGLLAVELQKIGVPARSWQGWQIPLITSDEHSSAKILEISTKNIQKKFKEGMRVAVVSGFQGVSTDNRVTTLGRGGSDTSAVAIAASFSAKRCDIYTDVDGVYTTDPRICNKARKLERISYEEMLELASLGAKVLQTRSVSLAMRYKVELNVLSSFSNHKGTTVSNEEDIMEKNVITGIAYSRDEAKLTLTGIKDQPGIAASIFSILSNSGINVDMIVQNISENNLTNMTFSCQKDQTALAKDTIEKAKINSSLDYKKLIIDDEIAKLSIVGIGMKSNVGVATKMFEILSKERINIIVISTSEIKISVLIKRKYLELALHALHDGFELDKE